MTQEYVLVVLTDNYIGQARSDDKDALKVIIDETVRTGIFVDHHDDSDMSRYIPMNQIRFFDIMTADRFQKQVDESKKQRDMYEAQQREMQARGQQGGGGDNIIQIPGRGM